MAMLASGKVATILWGFVLCVTATASAAEEEAPDIEFLEYLGMWEASDEDWQLLDESVVAENEERSDPVPEGNESAENEDES